MSKLSEKDIEEGKEMMADLEELDAGSKMLARAYLSALRDRQAMDSMNRCKPA